ncbi:MAG: hypothetical protein RLZZ135_1570 [Cyanobacteriota bacterium]|jgi:hypothetical protein
MQSIIFPLQTSDFPTLANLQDALQLFLDRVSVSNYEELGGTIA